MFLNELFNKTAKKGLLFAAKLALTPECNLTCRHCYVGFSQSRTLKTEEFKEVISQLARSGCLFLTLTGGEPITYPGFWEIISFARQSKFFIRLFTNGTLIEEKAAVRLARYGVNEVYVSLYGHKPDIHELITGVCGSFDKTVKSIILLKRQGINVQVKSSIMTLNKEYPLEIENFCRKLGVKCNSSYLLSPRTDGSSEPCLLQYPDGLKSEMFSRIPPKSPTVSSENATNPCPAAENSCFIEYDGILYPCVNYRYPCGSLLETSLHELWNSKKISEVREGKLTPGQCIGCSAINNCLRCPGLSYHEWGAKNGYSRFQCCQTGLLEYIKERSVETDYESIC
jgi:radical SAM protein with 4Fe4S-binding SPASM domain